MISGFRPGAPLIHTPSQISTSQARLPSPHLGYSLYNAGGFYRPLQLARVLRKTRVCRIVRLTHPPPLQLSVGRLQATTTIALHLALPSHQTSLGHGGQDAIAPPCGDPSRQCEGPRKTTIGERWTSVAEQTKGLTRERCCFRLDCC